MDSFRTGSIAANGVRFSFLEMGEGPLVLCLHGFPDNAYSFSHLLPELARAGFRAVAPFMRGYAPTEVPADGRYQSAVLSRDVLELMPALGAERAYLVGNDWGARAAYGAAILEPAKVVKLVTLASAHPGASEAHSFQYLKGTWHAFYFQLPVAEETLPWDDFAFIEEWWRDASPEWDIRAADLERVKETFRQPGVVEAALGYYRHSYDTSRHDPALKEDQERVDSGQVRVPTLALHGTRDRPRRLEAFEGMDRFFLSGLQKVVIPGTGHFMHREKPEEVNSRIVEFLSRGQVA